MSKVKKAYKKVEEKTKKLFDSDSDEGEQGCIDKIVVYRVEMSQILISNPEPLENDYSTETNFRSNITFSLSENEVSIDDQNYSSWMLTNKYAQQGSVKGFVTANIMLEGLNKFEHKILRHMSNKFRQNTLYSVIDYLSKDRKLSTSPVMDKFDELNSSRQLLHTTERQDAWGQSSIYDSDDQHIVNQRYTYVLGRSKKKKLSFMFVIALKTRVIAGLDDVYAKHGTLVDTDKFQVEAAGEMSVLYDTSLQRRREQEFVISLDNDSGTYWPSMRHVERLKRLLTVVFQKDASMKQSNWRICVLSRPMLMKHDSTLSAEKKDDYSENYIKYMSLAFPQAPEQREDINKLKKWQQKLASFDLFNKDI